MAEKCPGCGATCIEANAPLYECESMGAHDHRPFQASKECLRRQLADALAVVDKLRASVGRYQGALRAIDAPFVEGLRPQFIGHARARAQHFLQQEAAREELAAAAEAARDGKGDRDGP